MGEICLIIINGLLLVTSIVIACILNHWKYRSNMTRATKATEKAAQAAQESADLTRQQVIALQQAVVRMSVYDFQLESPTLQPDPAHKF